MNEEYPPCENCHKTAVIHDRNKGQVRCKLCGLIQSFHYEDIQNEVRVFEEDQENQEQARVIKSSTKSLFKNEDYIQTTQQQQAITKGGHREYDQPNDKKEKQEKEYSQCLKQIQRWCEKLAFKGRIADEVEIQFNKNLKCIPENEYTKRRMEKVAAISIFQTIKETESLSRDEQYEFMQKLAKKTHIKAERLETEWAKQKDLVREYNIRQSASQQPGIPIRQFRTLPVNICKKIINAGLINLPQTEINQTISLCQIIEERNLKNGEQSKTIAGAVLYFICKMVSRLPELNAKTWRDIASLPQINSSDETLKKFYDKNLVNRQPEIVNYLRNQGAQYQQN